MANHTQLAKIYIQDPTHAKAIGEIYLSVDQAEIAKNGHLFILINLTDPQPDYETFVGGFIEKASTVYYQSALEDPTKLLEYTLNELNNWLPENLPPNKKILGQLNIVIGNLKDNILNIATVGEWQAYLIHLLKTVDVLGRSDLTPNPVKLFENVITGNLMPGYGFLIANPSLLDYLSLDKVRKIISTIPAQSAAEQIKNMVSPVPSKVSFIAVIVKNSKPREDELMPVFMASKDPTVDTAVATPKPPIPKPRHSKESIDRLMATQSATQRVLTIPSSWQTVSAGFKNLFSGLQQMKIIPLLWQGVKKLVYYLWQFIKILFGLMGYLAKQIKNITLSLLRPDKIRPKLRLPARIASLKQLNFKNKIILISVVILIIVLAIITIPSGRKSTVTTEQLAELEKQFTAKEETVEAALIYGDRIRAQNLLTEIHDLIASLPPAKKKHQAQLDDLNQRATILTERIWNIMDIADPVELFNLASVLPDNQLLEIKSDGDNIYLFTNGTQFIIYNIQDKSYRLADYPGNFTGIIKTTISPDQKILVIDNQQQFFIVDDASLQPVLISLAAGLQQITAATSFYNRLYILDKESDQIYRHRLSGTTYQAPDLWLKDNIDLVNARAIAIDGYVYILANNKIAKLVNGRQQSFPNINIYPALEDATDLFTNINTDYLYILEPSKNRVLIFDKEGKLKNQYRSDKFINLQAFNVQEEAKRMFLITATKLFIIPL